MTTVAWGMPSPRKEEVTLAVATRRTSRPIMVGTVPVGGDAPVSVRSMTTTPADIDATPRQIAELTAAGCEVVRVAAPSADDAAALPTIARKSGIPVIADVHFQVRVNPGNILQFDDQVGGIARAAKDAGGSIRPGVHAGSLDERLPPATARARSSSGAR